MKVYLSFKHYNQRICNLINSLNLTHDEHCSTGLIINSNSLELYNRENLNQKAIKVDFSSKKNNYRCHFFRKKHEILYKAVGIKKAYFPVVLDATAGLGNDAFILSFLGCKVTMIERHPIVFALLKDGLYRGYKDKKIGTWLQERLNLILNDSCNMLKIPLLKPDVVYLDPMYPINKKKSLPKKYMQIFRKLIGKDTDAKELLNIAQKKAKKRVVVKRPCYAKSLCKEKISFVILGKKHRFDVYNPL
ncbi:16S rRNA methyltransferase [Buchnera aphidicola (Brachycaudus cardui)]|uniref:Ribosomal RNA small subunit methyltransferase J n=1 Tax=Buchnera aphidicola (Brachycaudus cardui) TaxID=557993 RepID=A0A4D6Y293_9GAMM|nr:class I SAM-dependent methyltransferase [Buchnera aphidicola]QCI20704.1 16S rRNA methyltransferase [Buchnera aphidicola (Brachycaudus cardui)]